MLARMNFVLGDDLDKEFRQAVSDRLGMKKGNIQIAVEEALRDWIKKKK